MGRDVVAFISYARQDGEAFATKLRERMEKEEPEITLWLDRMRMDGGVDFEEQIKHAIDSVQYLILVMTPAAMRSKWVAKEWRYAREQGVCICPVNGAPASDLREPRESLPRWMSQAHSFDLEKEWTRFVAFVKSPCQATRVPFMAGDLPANFVQRPGEFQQILDRVLDEGHKNPSGKRVVLCGSGGFGKTTLALSACHNDDVIAACDGGILWATLGEQPSLQGELTKLYAALTNLRPQFVDADDAAIELSKKLAGKRCLIVIDDVWDGEHLKPFLRGAGPSTHLITTRSSKIAAEATEGTHLINVSELKPAEAEQLLISRLAPPPKDLASFRKLATRLGEWPLLLELANGTLLEQVTLGETVEEALAWVNQALDKMGVVAFDRENATARRQAIAKTVEVSLSLVKEKRERCLELAIFPDDTDIPLAIIGLLWGTDEFETRRLAQRLNELSLVKLNLPSRTLRLHDAMRAYLATQLSEPTRLHGKLGDAWKDPTQVAGYYALRHAAFHLVEAMADSDQARSRGAQLLGLLTDARFRDYQQKQGDLVALNQQLVKALEHASASPDPQSPLLVAALAIVLKSYTVEGQAGWIFERARQGKLVEAQERLDLFDVEPEWRTAARLAIAWLGTGQMLAEGHALAEMTANQCDRPELQSLLAWVRRGPDGIPDGLPKIQRGPDLFSVSLILQRAGGGSEGAEEGIEPLNTSLLGSGIASDASGFIAEADGPSLVAFASLDPEANTQYLRKYISIHAANKYRYYRNRSLWALLKPVLEYSKAWWVRALVEELITSALTVTPVNFQDSVPLAVTAIEGRAGKQAAAESLEKRRQRLLEEAADLSPLRGKGDLWAHYQRRAAALAEVYALALEKLEEATRLLDAAREMPKGFAGFRAYSALTLAEAVRITLPADRARIDAALLSARAASHRIQDHPFCLQTTAIVNAMRSRWWAPAGFDIETVVGRFLTAPNAPEFCAVHRVGEAFEFRGDGPHTLPIPPQVLAANTLQALSGLFRCTPASILEVNQDSAWGLDDSLPVGAEVNIPDPDFLPLLAARFAAEVLALPLPAARRSVLIQSLVPPATSNPTALDTVLSRLLLSAADTPLKFPQSLIDLCSSN
jgi:hypothetical protein